MWCKYSNVLIYVLLHVYWLNVNLKLTESMREIWLHALWLIVNRIFKRTSISYLKALLLCLKISSAKALSVLEVSSLSFDSGFVSSSLKCMHINKMVTLWTIIWLPWDFGNQNWKIVLFASFDANPKASIGLPSQYQRSKLQRNHPCQTIMAQSWIGLPYPEWEIQWIFSWPLSTAEGKEG